jgi:hypothetical protein
VRSSLRFLLGGGFVIATISAWPAAPRSAVAHAGDHPGGLPLETLMVAAPGPEAAFTREQVESMARGEPLRLLKLAMELCEERVSDYRCTLYKQERVNGKLGQRQVIEVRYREQPLSVFMIWRENPDRVSRALFIDSPEYVNGKGEKVARVEPAGLIARALVRETTCPIRGADARAASRRFMDEFGFEATLEMVVRYSDQAERNGELRLIYEGEGRVDGRPTYVLKRLLPYSGPTGRYPDAKLVVHLDQEWLLPTAVYSYGDEAGRELLGAYEFGDVNLAPQFSARDFDF